MRLVTFLATKKANQSAPVFTQVHYERDKQVFVIGGKEYEAQEVTENGKVVDHRLGPLLKPAKGEERERIPRNILASDTFTLRHGDHYDIDDFGDRLMVELFMDTGRVANNRREVNPAEHRLYLDNPHEEAKVILEGSKVKREVSKRLAKMSPRDFRDFAFADKKSVLVDSMTPDMLEAYAWSEMDKNPQRVLDLLEMKEFKVKAFLGRLVQHNLVYINAGQYRIGAPGGDVLGIDEPSAIAYLIDPANNLIAKNWHQKLKELKEDTAEVELAQLEKP